MGKKRLVTADGTEQSPISEKRSRKSMNDSVNIDVDYEPKSKGIEKKSPDIEIENESELFTNSKTDTSNTTPITIDDFMSLLKNPETAEKGLQLFLDRSEDDQEGDIVVELCQKTSTGGEVTSLLHDNSIHKPAVFQVLECVLIRISRDLPEYTKLGASVARELSSAHMAAIRASLAASTNIRIKSALKLLVAMVTADTHCATQVAGQLRELSPCLTKLLYRKNVEDPQDVRTCAVLFIISFLINGSMLLINRLIECQDICAALFQPISSDDSCTIQLILSSVVNKVMRSEHLNKTAKLHLVRCIAWDKMADVFYWQGKRAWNDHYVVTAKSQFEQTDEQTTVATAIEEFLLALCTSSRLGIMFNDYTYGTSNLYKNKTILRVLSCLRFTHNSRVRRVIVSVLQHCPDVIQPYVARMSTLPGAVFYALLHDIFAAQPEHPRCMSYCRGVPVSELVERTLVTILPQYSVMNDLGAQFLKGEITVRRDVTRMYILSLTRLRAVQRAIDHKLCELSVYREAERAWMVDALVKKYRAAFPTVNRVVSAVKSFVSLIQQDPQGERSGDHASYMLILQRFVTLYKAALYPQTSLNLVYSGLADVTKLLQTTLRRGVAGVEGEGSNRLLQLHMLNIVASDSGSHALVFQHQSGTQSTLISRLLDQLVDISDDRRLFSIAKRLLSKVCLVTGLFNDQPTEIDVWLSPLSSLTHHPRRVDIVRFLSRTLCGFVMNPVAYQSAVSELTTECRLPGKEAHDARGNEALDVDAILAMSEEEINNTGGENDGRLERGEVDMEVEEGDERCTETPGEHCGERRGGGKPDRVDIGDAVVKIENPKEGVSDDAIGGCFPAESPRDSTFSPLVVVALNGLLNMQTQYEHVRDYLDPVLLGLLHQQRDPRAFRGTVTKYAPELAGCPWLPYLLSGAEDCGIDVADFKSELAGLSTTNRPLSLLIRAHLSFVAGTVVSQKKLTRWVEEISESCGESDDVGVFTFVRAIFSCLSAAVRFGDKVASRASRFYFRLFAAIYAVIVDSERNESGDENGDDKEDEVHELEERERPDVLAAKLAEMILENDDIKDNFNLSPTCSGLQTSLTEMTVEFLKLVDLASLAERSRVIGAYLRRVEAGVSDGCVTPLMLTCFQVFLPFMESSLMRTVLGVVFTSHKQVLVGDDDGGMRVLTGFGRAIFGRIESLTVTPVKLLRTIPVDIVDGIIEVAVDVKTETVRGCLKRLIETKMYAGEISRAVFAVLLEDIRDETVGEICRAMVEQNGRLLRKYVSQLAARVDLDVEVNAPLLLTCLNISDRGKSGERITTLCDQVLDQCLTVDSEVTGREVTESMAQLCLVHLSQTKDPDKILSVHASLLERTKQPPLTDLQTRLLISCLDHPHLPGSASGDVQFVSASLRHLSYKTPWMNGTAVNGRWMGRLLATLGKMDKGQPKKEWLKLWSNVVKYSLRSQYDNPTLFSLFNCLVPLLYTDNTEPQLPLSSFFEMLMSHSMFVPAILGQRSPAVKESLVDVLLTCVQQCPAVCHQQHLEIFLSAYNASLSLADRKILSLMRLYEKQGVEMSKLRPYLWGEMAQDYFSVKGDNPVSSLNNLPSTHHLIDNIDSERLDYSAIHFPLSHSLKSEEPSSPDTPPDPRVYDPAFVLPLFSHMLASENLVQCHRFLEKGCLGYVLTALSSRDSGVRGLAYLCVTRFYQQAEGARFYEKDMVLPLIDLLRNSVREENQRLGAVITAFLRGACLICLDPGSFMYRPLSKLILGKSSISLDYLPDFYLLFFGANINSTKERAWILRVIHEGTRDLDDYAILAKKRAFSILQTFYESPLSNNECRTLVLKIILSTVQHTQQKLVRQGLLVWLASLATQARRDRGELEALYAIVAAVWDTHPRTHHPQSSDNFLPQTWATVLNELTSPRSSSSTSCFKILLTTCAAINDFDQGASNHPRVPLTGAGAAMVALNYLKVTNDTEQVHVARNVCAAFGLNVTLTADRLPAPVEKNEERNEKDAKSDENSVVNTEEGEEEETRDHDTDLDEVSRNVVGVLLRWDARSDIETQGSSCHEAKLILGYLISRILLSTVRSSVASEPVKSVLKWVSDFAAVLPRGLRAELSPALVSGAIDLLPVVLRGYHSGTGDVSGVDQITGLVGGFCGREGEGDSLTRCRAVIDEYYRQYR